MKFNDNAPIYLQIIEDIKSKIITGHYQAGQRVESVRDMALEYGINPNTIQRALSECENQGLLYNEGPNGRYISQDQTLLRQLKSDQIKLVVQECVNKMRQYGLTTSEMIECIKAITNKETGHE
ncbi:MAG: GntR family transcriptional regulator [Erysipelothrix sp.]|nr:GntR family transcriptional regulator [Erysipelothrix sp.]